MGNIVRFGRFSPLHWSSGVFGRSGGTLREGLALSGGSGALVERGEVGRIVGKLFASILLLLRLHIEHLGSLLAHLSHRSGREGAPLSIL